jgi:hypothetical protein
MKYKNLQSMNLDITDHVTAGNVEKVAELVSSMDESIKHSYIPSIEETASRNENDFALILFDSRNGYRNKLAHYNKELTTLNTQLLSQKVDELPDEMIKVAATHLKKAAVHFKVDFPENLEPFVDDLIVTNTIDVNSDIDKKAYYLKLEEHKEVPTTMEYALPAKEKYPIHTEPLTKKAFLYFKNYARELDVVDRIEYAKNLFPKLAEFKIEPTALIEKLAHIDTKSFNPDFPHHIRSRTTMTHNEETRDAYLALLEKVAEWTPIEVASALNKIDKNANLHYQYDRKIEEPVAATLGMKKEALYEIDDRVLSESDYSSLIAKDLSSWIDSDTQDALKSDEGVDVFRSLPSPIREGILSELEQ